jgi:succinate dehydrogenase/fumarate reductase iron-sulfur protein
MPRIHVSVQRSPRDGGRGQLAAHDLELGAKASILDALFALQRGPCPDLAFRFSCRVGMCGSCAVVVNGRERLACTTLVSTIGERLQIEPLRNLPQIRDLAVDMKPFFDAYARVMPQFIPRDELNQREFYQMPRENSSWRMDDRQPQCIDCGACWSACALVGLHPRYAGPMALHRALTLVTDLREKAARERLDLVAGEAGAFRCHTLGNCREACPSGISPTRSIERLKRLAAVQTLTRVFRRPAHA